MRLVAAPAAWAAGQRVQCVRTWRKRCGRSGTPADARPPPVDAGYVEHPESSTFGPSGRPDSFCPLEVMHVLRHYAKVGAFVVVSVILAAEAHLLYEHYDRYYSGSTTPGLAASGVTVSKEATRRDPSGLDVGDGPDTFEDATSQTTSDAGNAGSGTPGSGESFVHRASDDNSRGDYTYLTHPSIDGDPDDLVLVAPYPNGGDAEDPAYDHNIGVWYEFVDHKKWAIFNQDRAAVPPGTAFKVLVPQSSGGFVHRAEPSNTQGHTSFLDDPLTNQKPDAVVSVAQNWNPGRTGGVYNDHPTSVRYHDDAGAWAIHNRDGAPIPDGAAFNVAVSGDAGSAR